jgi:hypothetical protein
MIDEKVDIRIAELGKLISFGFQCLGSPYEFDSGVPVGIRATHGFQISFSKGARSGDENFLSWKRYKILTRTQKLSYLYPRVSF